MNVLTTEVLIVLGQHIVGFIILSLSSFIWAVQTILNNKPQHQLLIINLSVVLGSLFFKPPTSLHTFSCMQYL